MKMDQVHNTKLRDIFSYSQQVFQRISQFILVYNFSQQHNYSNIFVLVDIIEECK